MTTATATHCDKCGRGDQPLEAVEVWHFCPVCKADRLAYNEGRRHAALDGFDRAVTAALSEDFTHDQLRQALDLRLREGAGALDGEAGEFGGLYAITTESEG